MKEREEHRVKITKSAVKGNPPISRLLEDPDGYLERERTFDSEEAAKLEAIRLSILGERVLRLQPAGHDTTEYHAYINSTGKSSGGYGRTTRNASSGWLYTRKQTMERDGFECQECGALGGADGDVELHVDHITPKNEGWIDDLDNLRTLCRDCHMDHHDSVPDAPRAAVGELAETISRLAADAEVPAFRQFKLYIWVDEVLDAWESRPCLVSRRASTSGKTRAEGRNSPIESIARTSRRSRWLVSGTCGRATARRYHA